MVGGGLTGLTAAHRLMTRATRPIQVVVIEAKERVGGAIWTRRRDGFTLEGGADCFITSKPWGLELCRELGLEAGLIGTDPSRRRSFVVRQGRLIPIPDGFVMMAPNRLIPLLTTPILSLRGKLRMLLDLVLPRKVEDTDESLAAFVRRRLGREALDRLIQPLVGGIYTADPAELSLRATLPQFLDLEARYGSLIRGALLKARRDRSTRNESGARYGLFVTPEAGMGRLPEALAAALPSGAVRTSTAVRRIVRADNGRGWRVELLAGPPVDAAAVVLATEAHAAARLVDALDPELALNLRAIPYASSAIVNLAFRRDQIAHPLDGFGAVVPLIEQRAMLAVSFTSIKFPCRAPAGTVLMRLFFGGALQPELFDMDDAALLDLARREVAELLGANGEPLLAEVVRHPRGMPQYVLGHLNRVAQVRSQIAAQVGLVLAGNYLDGVGVPDCIRSGQLAADSVLETLAARDNSAAA